MAVCLGLSSVSLPRAARMQPGCQVQSPARLQMCADKSEAEHKETAARNKILEDKLVGIEGVMEGAPCPQP